MGIAVIKTIEITYDSFLESPFIAPEVAIAADTPQIETAEEIIIVNSASIFIFLHNQNAKYHTERTTTKDCIKPIEPAFRISENITVVPKSTNPIFTKKNVERAALNQSGS